MMLKLITLIANNLYLVFAYTVLVYNVTSLNITVEGVGATALNVTWKPPVDVSESTAIFYRITLLEASVTMYASHGAFNILLRSGALVENTTYT